jgi:hypothetical protein
MLSPMNHPKPSQQLMQEMQEAMLAIRAKHADLQANDPEYWNREPRAASMPTMLRPIGELVSAIPKVAHAVVTPESDMSRRRLEVCKTCENWTGHTCKVCGCFTALKVRLPAEACPIGKWQAER